ncbi:MAG TPA: AAA family ATPase [Myxococcota bacterium]|nr:AAA family ATPase [Myxococcota bacterium]
MKAARPIEPLPPRLIAGLRHASAYPKDPSARGRIAQLQTHLSHVFLTGEKVYKLRKAVDLGFVCFATRAQRDADCVREVALGRRLAPDVYLGVAPVGLAGRRVRVGAFSDRLTAGRAAVEHCVVMRRLPLGRDALSLLVAGRLRSQQIDRVALAVARFHAQNRLSLHQHGSASAWLERSVRPVRQNFELLREASVGAPGRKALLRAATLARAEALASRFVASQRARFEARRRARRGVDGHGDLHLQHVFFETDDAAPLLIDCLEFRDDLRQIDAAAEVAFLAMDLRYRGRAKLAERFLRTYAAAADDYDLYGVVDYYVRYRAAVRAKVAAVAALDPQLATEQQRAAAASARRHLALAARTRLASEQPAVVVLCGLVGTGKSFVARAAADLLGGVVISSDVVRRRGGAPPVYTERGKDRIYTELLERAKPVVESGRVAILDATFDRARRRALVLRFAAAHRVPALLLETRSPPAITFERLARRKAAGRDPSQAGPELYAWSSAHFEPPREWPAAWRRALWTNRPWRHELSRALAALRANR